MQNLIQYIYSAQSNSFRNSVLSNIYTLIHFLKGPGIGVPFNVQHVAHIGADNVEALLLAAKDDPKLLPSFLLPDALVDVKEGGKKSVEIGDTKTGVLT